MKEISHEVLREHGKIKKLSVLVFYRPVFINLPSVNYMFSAANFFLFCLLMASCSVPNLEKPECAAARQTVKELYSFHFGNDMKLSKENLKQREKFLTDDLKQYLFRKEENPKDYFTGTVDYPKAFRVGVCDVVEPVKKVNFQILLFWKDDKRNEQREINVEIVNKNDKWLVNKVEN